MAGLYSTARWRRERRAFLAEHPLCEPCTMVGRVTAATVVDHLTPHRGNPALFWDQTNWGPTCAPCHDRLKQSQEKGGTKHLAACDASGLPVHPEHPWNAARG